MENTYILQAPGMRVSGMIFADEYLMEKMKTDRTLKQCANVAHLPGIYKYALTLPDGHEGYTHAARKINTDPPSVARSRKNAQRKLLDVVTKFTLEFPIPR